MIFSSCLWDNLYQCIVQNLIYGPGGDFVLTVNMYEDGWMTRWNPYNTGIVPLETFSSLHNEIMFSKICCGKLIAPSLNCSRTCIANQSHVVFLWNCKKHPLLYRNVEMLWKSMKAILFYSTASIYQLELHWHW